MPLTVPDCVLAAGRPELAEFFLCFARFEFSLKASGFARRGKWGAEVNWAKFANAVEPLVLPPEAPSLLRAVTYLLTPPAAGVREQYLDLAASQRAADVV